MIGSRVSVFSKRFNFLQSTSSRLSLNKLNPSLRRNSKTVTISSDSAKSQSKGRVQVLPLPATAPVDDATPNSEDPESSKRCGCSPQSLGEKLLSIFKCGKKGTGPEKIDFACRILFPLTYVIYNSGYWYVYLNGIEILDWDSHTVIESIVSFPALIWYATQYSKSVTCRPK